MRLVRSRRASPLSLASLSDIAFLLLVFVMISVIETSQRREPPLTLPAVHNANVMPDASSIEIRIDHSGMFFLNGRSIEEAALISRLDALKNRNTIDTEASTAIPLRVYLAADQKAAYIHIHRALKALARCKIDTVYLEVRPVHKEM